MSHSQGGVTLSRQLSFDSAAQAGHAITTIRGSNAVILQMEVAATKEGQVNAT